MTSTPPEAPPPVDGGQGPRVTRDQVRDLGRLRRSLSDRKVAGVAGGLGRHLDIDPVILRVAFVVLVFFGGAGLILYGALWLLVPEQGRDRAAVSLDERSRSIALIIVGVLAALALLGDSLGRFWFPWPLAIIALVVLLFVTRRDHPSTPPAAGTTPYGAPDQPYGSAAAAAYQPAQQPTYDQPANDPTAYQPPTYQPPAWTPSAAPVRPPRRRGPILFWFTLALIALAEGVLGIVDLAGASVAGSAYPAVAVGISGLMLLVGAFYGRAGGLILVGLVSTAVLAGATAADRWQGTTLNETPTSAAAVQRSYDISTGEIVLDLTHVRNVNALAGRTLQVSADVGRLEVIVPPGLDTTVHADINGPGSIRLFGDETGGIGIEMTRNNRAAAADAPLLTINADLEVGRIEVHQ